MKKILMLALVRSLATGAFAQNTPKKKKKSKQCTEQTCKPECKPQDCCSKTACVKA